MPGSASSRVSSWGQPNNPDKAWTVSDHVLNRFLVGGEFNAGNDQDGYFESISYSGSTSFFLPVNAGVPGDDNITGILLRPNYELTGVGTTQNGGGGMGDMFMFYEHAGFWATTAGTYQEDGGYSIDLAKDGGIVCSGYTTGYLGPVPNMYLVKFDTSFSSTGVLGIRENTIYPNGSAHVFPNPATSDLSITVDYQQPVDGDLTITVYN